jgi:hypothetical protein
VPERITRTISVDTLGEAEVSSYPHAGAIAEVERTRMRLFETDSNAINNFFCNVPGGRHRDEMEPGELQEYKKNYPDEYEEYLEFFNDIDRAVAEAGLDVSIIEEMQKALYEAVCSLDSSRTPENMKRCMECHRTLDRYIFPAYEILRLKYGYKANNLCS